MAELQVSVVSADHEIWTGTASMVVAKTLVGEIGIMPGHEPFLAILASGEARITTTNGASPVRVSAEEGFISFEHDTITIVARQAELVTG